MPHQYKLKQQTHLRLYLQTENKIGVSRKGDCELIPNTPTARKRLGVQRYIGNVTNFNFDKETLDEAGYNLLRDYQQEDAAFLALRKAVGVFNQQRTGKTPTSLISLKLKKCKKILIVCPASMVLPWKQEFEQWYKEPCVAVIGTPAQKKKAIEEWTSGLVIGYESLRMVDKYINNEDGTKTYSHSTGELATILKHKDIDAVLLDEAHRIRNHKTKTAKAVFKLNKIFYRMVLTGTPTLKKQEELFSILHFLYPTLFTSYWRFIDYYFDKEYRDIYIGGRARQTTEVGRLRRPEELQELLDMMSTQRKRIDVMSWLPEKDKQTIYFDLTKQQSKYIKELKEFFETDGITTVGVLDTLLRERQICLSPALLSLGGGSPKLDWIRQYLSDYPDKQVIIFSKFTQWLELIATELNLTGLYTGKTSKINREKMKTSFQAGDLKVLLIQIDSGKEGLTLDNADTIIFTDKFPPIGDIEQAEDRLVATAKHKVKEGQVIYTLAMKQSYEMNILKGLSQSAAELDIINDYKKYLERRE